MLSQIIEKVKGFIAQVPEAVAATVTLQKGTSVDRKGYLNGYLCVLLGAITGTGAYSAFTIETSNSSTFAVPADIDTLQTITTFPTAQNTMANIKVPLANAKRYIRVSFTLTIGGGGTTIHSMMFSLGDKDENPV